MSQSDVFHVIIATPETLNAKFRAAYTHAEMMLRNGEQVELKCGPGLEPIGVQQRRFLHGVVLRQIAEQVQLPIFDKSDADTGQRVRYDIDAWKELFRKMLIPPKHVMRRAMVLDKNTGLARPARKKTPHAEKVSTETLGVRGYSRFIDEVIDHAVRDFGVVFEIDPAERESVRYKPNRTNEARAMDAGTKHGS